MIIVGNAAFCQDTPMIAMQKITSLSSQTAVFHPFQPLPVTILSGNFSTQHLGYFCRQEMKLQKITGIPLRFRLGSLRYTDWLEGKKDLSALQVLP